MSLLDQKAINENMNKLSGSWKYDNNQLELNAVLKDFAENLKVVNKIGEYAEAMDHHPDILIHGWNKLKIMISTHSEGGVTEKDFILAEKIEEVLKG
ncbi:MAG: 4a-hydroxytetrahydrobiopterin dehydratase [Ignavibacteriaceae bacterium]|nr:4a-hydroxytetrahydrobiopterin dehydratase [Ignavibacteriaceae bacterium]NUM70331.1 4a-hydroxytetrahydrobiopterin dehydratase [Ignavibacteriaceae bacterium]